MIVKRYKPGDKVVVRCDLNIRKRYGNIAVADEMIKMGGRTLTIINVYRPRNEIEAGYEGYYNVKETSWCWTDEMFEEYSIVPAQNKATLLNDSSVCFDKNIDELFSLLKL